MKEIGGYFGLEQYKKEEKKEYYSDLIALNTARNALVYLFKAKNIKKIYIPYLLCDSVSLVCDREGFKYEYYHTDKNFHPIFDKNLVDDEYLYIVNLYGQISNDEFVLYKHKYGRIIVDNIHAFFQKPVDGIDTIYSCRKFFGVPDGSYLSTDYHIREPLKKDCSESRIKHIYGRIKDGASAHYTEFRANDESFEKLPLMEMSSLTHDMLSVIDYEKARKIRSNNYKYLYDHLSEYNLLKLNIVDGAYAYPFYCSKGMAIRNELAKINIFVATLWPNVLKNGSEIEKDYSSNILPLPCDQRYSFDDMDLIIKNILKLYEENQ